MQGDKFIVFLDLLNAREQGAATFTELIVYLMVTEKNAAST